MIEIFRPGENPLFKDCGYEPVDPWSVQIVSRSEWGALPAKEEIEALPLPVTNIGFWGTEEIDDGVNGVCKTKEECLVRVLELQKRHMEEGLPDIKYNFLIGDDGNIYEGRGWDKRSDVYYQDKSEFKKMNKHMIEVAYIGINDTRFIHYYMEEGFTKLVGQGVEKKFIQDDYRLFDLYAKDEFDEDEEQ